MPLTNRQKARQKAIAKMKKFLDGEINLSKRIESIKSKPMTTQHNYGYYLELVVLIRDITQAKIQGEIKFLPWGVMEEILEIAGASPQGVKSAIFSYTGEGLTPYM